MTFSPIKWMHISGVNPGKWPNVLLNSTVLDFLQGEDGTRKPIPALLFTNMGFLRTHSASLLMMDMSSSL
jgi:hypothetical protein